MSRRLVHGIQSSGKTNWYTPEKYIESARHVMGSIDVDPASCAFANERVRAKIFYTSDTNGLSHPWRGNVWLNPPYEAKAMKTFVTTLLHNLESGQTKQAILLTHNNTDTQWFHLAVEKCLVLCLTRGRVRFYDENGVADSPTNGHVFMYFSSGENRRKQFLREFSQYGFCLKGAL